MEEVLKSIEGAAELSAWFGGWPSFHDAEVVSLSLNRVGTSTLKIHTWRMRGEVDERGYYLLDKHVLITFQMEEILALSLVDFNHQNVVFGLNLSKNEDSYEIALDPCYGLSGTIAARKLSVEFEPMASDSK